MRQIWLIGVVLAGCGLMAWLGRVGIDMGQFAEGMSFMGMSRVIYRSNEASKSYW